MNPKERFTGRVSNYAKYRPRYPTAILEFMRQELKLSTESVIADVGSGTGILSEMFLRNGNLVYGIEPNREMREFAESSLAGYHDFMSVNGSAENTGLPAHSIDFITAAQSFHWFDQVKAKQEFLRILRFGGWAILIWNTRRKSTSFPQSYEKLVNEYSGDYPKIRHENVTEIALASFLGQYKSRKFDNFQLLDYQALVGRLLSSSYAPLEGDPRHEPMLSELRRIFDACQHDGFVRLEYGTELYYGQLR